MRGFPRVDFLVCPPESLLDGFAHRSSQMERDLVRAVSSHLSRCTPCREEVDRRRREEEAAGARRPWIWALAALAAFASVAGLFLWREPALPSADAAVRFTMSFTGRESGSHPDPRLAALARFEPPGDAAIAAGMGGPSPAPGTEKGPPHAIGPMLPEDERELAAARERLSDGAFPDAARLLEDLTARHPSRGGLRLLLGYAYARAGEYEKARWEYSLADHLGAGVDACIGLANASLRVGDIGTARRELTEHVLSLRPDDESARNLLKQINATQRRFPR